MAHGSSGYIFGSVDHDPNLGVQNYKSELRLHISFAFTTVDYCAAICEGMFGGACAL